MDDSIVLHHAPMSRGNIVVWMLEELGVPYRLNLLSFDKQDHKTPAYLAINPMGKVPALEHKGAIVTEAAAICAYLADAFPAAKLSVPIGDSRRGPYLKWLFFGPGCLEQAVFDRMTERPNPRPSASSYGDYDTTMETVAKGVAKGPYLLGEQFTAADVITGANLIFGAMMKAVPERPEFTAYCDRLKQRPANQRAQAKNQELYAQMKSKP